MASCGLRHCCSLSVWIVVLLLRHVAAWPQCPHDWAIKPGTDAEINESAECPHGHLFLSKKLDITLPHNATLFQKVSVFYGCVPVLIIFLSLGDTTMRTWRLKGIGTRELSFLCFVIAAVTLNELIFKGFARESRPQLSCANTCGFPSGHSTMAMGFFTLMFSDATRRVMPKMPLSLSSARSERRLVLEHARSPQEQAWAVIPGLSTLDRRWWSVLPLSVSDVLGNRDYFWFTMAWGFILLPVPISRIILHDHTAEQVLAGSVIGIIEAVVWILAVQKLVQEPHNHQLGCRFGVIFVHNYALPRFVVRCKCCRLLARIEDALQRCDNPAQVPELIRSETPDNASALSSATNTRATTESSKAAAHLLAGRKRSPAVCEAPELNGATWVHEVEELQQMHREIRWYLKQPRSLWASMTGTVEDDVFGDLEHGHLQPLQKRVEELLRRFGRPVPRERRVSQYRATTPASWGPQTQLILNSISPGSRESLAVSWSVPAADLEVEEEEVVVAGSFEGSNGSGRAGGGGLEEGSSIELCPVAG